ncbi:hypothetical protein B296_00028764, partial [Ensete ventricosum]
MYRSARLPVRGSPAIGQYRQNRSSSIDFGRRQSILAVSGQFREKSIVGDRLREKKGRRRRGKEERRKKKEEEKKKEYLAQSSLARRRRPPPRVAREPLRPSL